MWSWVVEIYAWLTIWNYFDLRQPQQPQRKSVKIQSCFCSLFVQILISFLLNLSLYDSKYARNDSWLDTIKICLVSQWLCKFFLHFWEKNFCLFQQFFSQVLQKLIKRLQKPNILFNLSSKLLISAYIEPYRLRIKRKLIKIWTKNEQKQLWILTLFIWGCWGCLRSK